MPMMRCCVSAVMNDPSTGPSDRLYGNRIVLSTVRAKASSSGRLGSRRDRTEVVANDALVRYETPMRVAPTGRQIEISSADQVAVVVELGGALRTYTVGARPRVEGYERDEMASGSRGQPLMPWPNRIEAGRYEFGGVANQLALSEPAMNNAIHGLVRYANWTVAEVETDRVTMAYTLYPQPGYPFPLDLEIEYALGDDGLAVRTTATNLGDHPCPFGAGFHPYLRLDPERIDSLELRSPAATSFESNEHMIPIARHPVAGTDLDFRSSRPIGATRMDTAFTDLERDAGGLATVRLRDPATRDTVALWCDASYPYLMVFTGDALPDEHRRRRGLAVEPMTCAPNAFRTGDGLQVLEAGGSSTGRWGIRARRGGAPTGR
jgi:aldose 1-epimerase